MWKDYICLECDAREWIYESPWSLIGIPSCPSCGHDMVRLEVVKDDRFDLMIREEDSE